MSMVEDVRQVLQDFLAPELRAITARLDAIEKVMDARFKEVDSRFKEMDSRFEALDARFDSKFNEVFVRIQVLQETVDRNDSAQKQLISSLTQQFQFDKRLSDIEREMRNSKSSAA